MQDLDFDNKKLSNEDLLEYFSKIYSFMKRDEGKFLYKILTETKATRVEDLIYSKNEELMIYKGELKAYNDMLTLLSNDNLKLKIEELNNLIQK